MALDPKYQFMCAGPGDLYEFELEDGSIVKGHYNNTLFVEFNATGNVAYETGFYNHTFKPLGYQRGDYLFSATNYIPNPRKEIPFSYIKQRFAEPIPIMKILVGAPLIYNAPVPPPGAVNQSLAQTTLSAALSIAPGGMAAAVSRYKYNVSPPSGAAAAASDADAASGASETQRNVDNAFDLLLEIGPTAIIEDFDFCCASFPAFLDEKTGNCLFQIQKIDKLIDPDPLKLTEVQTANIAKFKEYWGTDLNHKVSLVYHGTSGTGRRAIIEEGVVRPGIRGAYGPGAYFGTDPYTAMFYNTDGDIRKEKMPSTELLVCAVLSNSYNHKKLLGQLPRPRNFIITNGAPGSVLPMFLVKYDKESTFFNDRGVGHWSPGMTAANNPEPFVGDDIGNVMNKRRSTPGYSRTKEMGGTRQKRRNSIKRKARTNRKFRLPT